jgi:hypothetical protein
MKFVTSTHHVDTEVTHFPTIARPRLPIGCFDLLRIVRDDSNRSANGSGRQAPTSAHVTSGRVAAVAETVRV